MAGPGPGPGEGRVNHRAGNVRKLITERIASASVPRGGGLPDALALFLTPGKLVAAAREAEEWVRAAIAAVKAAPDNPYGDDDEAIAGEILRRLAGRKGARAAPVPGESGGRDDA